jgi:hypothetical protein
MHNHCENLSKCLEGRDYNLRDYKDIVGLPFAAGNGHDCAQSRNTPPPQRLKHSGKFCPPRASLCTIAVDGQYFYARC